MHDLFTIEDIFFLALSNAKFLVKSRRQWERLVLASGPQRLCCTRRFNEILSGQASAPLLPQLAMKGNKPY